MGVTGDLLPRILKTAGRNVDLSVYQDGIIDSSAKKNDNKRQRTSTRRPLRIGLDVGTVIARAAFGHGTMLLDERHLTNYGRSLLQAEANNNAATTDTAQAAAAAAVDARQAITSDENRRAYVNRCASYVMKRIHTLKNVSGGQVLVVFDGATPPIKDEECIKRSQKRKQAAQERDEPLVADEAAGANTKRRVRAARRAGAGKNHGDILVEVMQELRRAKISFLVSPYEADGQLAFLSEKGLIDLVVTEDSDLIAHGCDSILYKTTEGLGKGVAKGILVQKRDLGALGMVQKSLSLQDFSGVMLATMFVALGCDYCSSLKMIGSVAARDIVRVSFHGENGQSEEERQKPALQKVFERLYRQTSEKNLTDDEKKEYEKSFLEALLMFRHPMVYDPFVGKCVLLRNPPHGSDPELMEYEPYARLCNDVRRREQILGTCHGPTTSTRIAEGWVSPRTKRVYEDMEIPATAREPPLSLSASESDEDDQPQTQELQSTAATTSQAGPDTQDMMHVETQLVGAASQSTPGSAVRGPDTQDLSRVESQLGGTTPSQRLSDAPQGERTVTFGVTFKEKSIGILLGRGLAVKKITDADLAGEFVQVGDRVVGINGNDVERGITPNQLKEIVHGLTRPVNLTFCRRVEGNDVADDDVAASTTQGSSQLTQQSPLTGSSSSRLGSQPMSQFSAESQISPGVRSPSLLDSQPS